eukprot:TRINITY_DN9071_c0_g1_i1.p1 TRINITY_DN9071_c0_g1~~TRINITY_DN9071_c0_g1_i1.p1  ORF type:complete len:135 (+),score=43.87 TRINITY_DN9071_c0_g1_i1:21-425(+)
MSESEYVGRVSIVASPLAEVRLAKKLLRLTKKGAADKQVRKGVKEVCKAIRKGEKGLCVLAGDISPIDVITHIPVLCEDAEIPYVFVPSKEALGQASRTKRPTSVVLISIPKKSENFESFKELLAKVVEMAPSY